MSIFQNRPISLITTPNHPNLFQAPPSLSMHALSSPAHFFSHISRRLFSPIVIRFQPSVGASFQFHSIHPLPPLFPYLRPLFFSPHLPSISSHFAPSQTSTQSALPTPPHPFFVFSNNSQSHS